MFAEWGTRQTRAAHLLLKRQVRLSFSVRFPASGGIIAGNSSKIAIRPTLSVCRHW